MCTPNINIFRDPRWGRGHETYGEDPMLTAMMATEFIKGLQGNGKYRKCDATLKHFAVHSGPESCRHGFDVEVGDDDLYGIYLKAFEYCIKNASPSAVMGAYNAVNGEPCTASKTLLQKILKESWGFEGYIESDAGAIEDINNHHKLTNTMAESAVLSVNNGCDLCLGEAYEHLSEAYEKGLITDESVTKAVERLFTARFRLGMFSDDCEYDNIPYEVVDCKKHKEVNLQMAHESIVLLKNDGILPVTFYASDNDLPDFKDYSMKNRTYKFFKGTPVYPFGHGLTYSDITENWIDDNTVEVINNGDYDTYYSILQYEYVPHKSLKDFKKIYIRRDEKKIIKFV